VQACDGQKAQDEDQEEKAAMAGTGRSVVGRVLKTPEDEGGEAEVAWGSDQRQGVSEIVVTRRLVGQRSYSVGIVI